jgi:cation diffusion facilitator CzcD-associated flavoprotein CzcO
MPAAENRGKDAGSASFLVAVARLCYAPDCHARRVARPLRRHRHRRRDPGISASTGCAVGLRCGYSRPAPGWAAPGTESLRGRDSEHCSDEILREHFAAQPETLRYCNFVADKLDLRRDIEFDCRIRTAVYDEAANQWEIETEDGRRARARFLITAIGPLSTPTMPTIPGVESFRGEAYHTGRWPHEPVSFAGKRVGVIGTGATAVQAITEIAKTVGHLTVFQRTPNWCAPLHNSEIDAATQARIKATYAEIFAVCRDSFGCFIHRAVHQAWGDAEGRGVLRALPRLRDLDEATSATCWWTRTPTPPSPTSSAEDRAGPGRRWRRS